MFDDAPSQHRVPPQYDVRNITSVPIALFVGGRDTIIDADRLISLLPPATVVHRLPKYVELARHSLRILFCGHLLSTFWCCWLWLCVEERVK